MYMEKFKTKLALHCRFGKLLLNERIREETECLFELHETLLTSGLPIEHFSGNLRVVDLPV